LPNNRIHTDTQSQGVFCIYVAHHKELHLPSHHWLWAQVMLCVEAVEKVNIFSLGSKT